MSESLDQDDVLRRLRELAKQVEELAKEICDLRTETEKNKKKSGSV